MRNSVSGFKLPEGVEQPEHRRGGRLAGAASTLDEGHGMQANGVWSLQPLADMSAAEFRDWQVLLENRTGVVLNEQRRTFAGQPDRAHA